MEDFCVQILPHKFCGHSYWKSGHKSCQIVYLNFDRFPISGHLHGRVLFPQRLLPVRRKLDTLLDPLLRRGVALPGAPGPRTLGGVGTQRRRRGQQRTLSQNGNQRRHRRLTGSQGFPQLFAVLTVLLLLPQLMLHLPPDMSLVLALVVALVGLDLCVDLLQRWGTREETLKVVIEGRSR